MAKASTQLPKQHDDAKAAQRYRSCQAMAASDVSEKKYQLLHGGPVGDTDFFCQLRQASFRNELIHENHKTNGSDEAPQKGTT